MTHSEVRAGYHEIAVHYPADSPEPNTDMFIGRFQRDRKYHLLGHRPLGRSDLFSAESESNQDLGVVELPNGKTRLSDLQRGETFTIHSVERKPYTVKYDRRK